MIFFAEYNEESNKKDFKFKIGDHVRISKYIKIFLLNDMLLIGQKKFLLLIKLTIPFRGLMLLVT